MFCNFLFFHLIHLVHPLVWVILLCDFPPEIHLSVPSAFCLCHKGPMLDTILSGAQEV